MARFVRPFSLGGALFPNNVFYSPLAGCSDFPFRRMAAAWRPGLLYCEMVSMDALMRNCSETYRYLDYNRGMHPIGAQIFGANPTAAAVSAKIIEDLGFDIVDLNCGCPVDKVTGRGGGSGLLKTPDLIGEILIKMVESVRIPVTVKVRSGWDDAHIVAPQITRIAESAGAVAIAVHGRTRQQGYRGNADWGVIRACKQAAQTIKVIGNGDIFNADAAISMFEETGCDAVLVSRGTMGNPWIAEDICRRDAGEEVLERSAEVRRQALLTHFRYICDHFPPKKALIDMRRVGCWYIKSSEGAREFRSALSRAKSLQEVELLIRSSLSLKEEEEGSQWNLTGP